MSFSIGIIFCFLMVLCVVIVPIMIVLCRSSKEVREKFDYSKLVPYMDEVPTKKKSNSFRNFLLVVFLIAFVALVVYSVFKEDAFVLCLGSTVIAIAIAFILPISNNSNESVAFKQVHYSKNEEE